MCRRSLSIVLQTCLSDRLTPNCSAEVMHLKRPLRKACCTLSICCLSLVSQPVAATLNSSGSGATGQAATAPSQAPNGSINSAEQDCEVTVLSLLGWQNVYDPGGYSINGILPSNCSLSTWESLGCLHSLVNLTLTGNLPSLPSSWAQNGSFPTLQSIDFGASNLVGTLPADWGQSTAFPKLTLLNLTATQLSGTLPEAWAQPNAFSKLAQLQLAVVNISGAAR